MSKHWRQRARHNAPQTAANMTATMRRVLEWFAAQSAPLAVVYTSRLERACQVSSGGGDVLIDRAFQAGWLAFRPLGWHITPAGLKALAAQA